LVCYVRDRYSSETHTSSLHDALPILVVTQAAVRVSEVLVQPGDEAATELMTVTATTKSVTVPVEALDIGSIKRKQRVTVVLPDRDRKSTRLNSSHVKISYAVFCLKKK